MSLLAAATTAAAWTRPGCRVKRSTGPEIETAATTRPDGPRTGADTEATPGSRSPMLCAQPRRRTADSVGRGEAGALEAAVQPVGLLPGEQHLGRRSGEHRQRGADRDRVPQADGPLGRGDADALVALAPVELGGLAGVVAQGREHRPGGGEQPVLARGRGELGEPRAEDEPALHVAADEAVVLQRDGEPVRGRPGQAGGGDELGQGGRPRLEGAEDHGGLVEHADSATLVHEAILPSHVMRRKHAGGLAALQRGRPLRPASAPPSRRARRNGLAGPRPSEEAPAVGRTLAEKVWDAHVVRRGENGEPDLLYIDLHLVHEVTSPQAFDGLRLAGRPVRRPDLTIATEDHNTPTLDIDKPIADPVSRTQIETLRRNCAEFGVRLHSLGDVEQGIVHVVGPQLGLTQPGMTVVCGDSHTSTHGAFGALAFGIGTSEVEHVLATQTLPLKPFKTMAITVEGALPEGSTAKDIILAVIARIGTGGGQGYVLEYRGEAIRRCRWRAG